MSQLNLPHGNRQLKSVKTEKLKSKNGCSGVTAKKSGESCSQSWRRKIKAAVGRICRKRRFWVWNERESGRWKTNNNKCDCYRWCIALTMLAVIRPVVNAGVNCAIPARYTVAYGIDLGAPVGYQQRHHSAMLVSLAFPSTHTVLLVGYCIPLHAVKRNI